MRTVSIDIETVLDPEAAERCGYTPCDDFAPFPLHTIVCASAFSVTSMADGHCLYAIESFSLGNRSERSIIAGVEEAVSDANRVYTFNGCRFDLPVLVTRAAVHDVHVPRLIDLQNRSRVGRHLDLFDQIKRDAAPVSLSHLCAPFAIPAKQVPTARVSELAASQDWSALEQYCESDTVACWLAAQFWNGAQEPGFARQRWRDLARWINAHPDEHRGLSAFATVQEAPRGIGRPASPDEVYF
jgi:hypothetical protein